MFITILSVLRLGKVDRLLTMHNSNVKFNTYLMLSIKHSIESKINNKNKLKVKMELRRNILNNNVKIKKRIKKYRWLIY